MDTYDIALKMLFDVALSGNNMPVIADEEARVRHVANFVTLIERNEEIVFVLPGFPAKSPNRQKTFGPLPDMAELIAMQRLHETCEHISEYYRPGARVVICSDGLVFGDLVKVSDAEVAAYGKRLGKIIKDYNFHRVGMFNTKPIFPKMGSDEMRRELVTQYGLPLEEVRNQIITCPDANSKFNGIHRFVLEDSVALEPEKSRNQIRKESKAIAYQVVQRSDSWGNLIKVCFPNAIRLSIHPQPTTSERIFFQLANCANTWTTPWHSTAMFTHRGLCLIRRHEAEAMGAKLEYTSCGLPYFSLS